MKVAIVCDWLTGIGGAERVVLELHRLYPKAPIYTSQYDPQAIDWFKDADVRTTWLQKLPPGFKKFLPVLRAIAFGRLDLSDYDLILSSSGAEAKAVRGGPKTVHISYCHSPTHYYWIRTREYLKSPGFGHFNWLARLGLKLFFKPMKHWDYLAAKRPDIMVANSTHTQAMIKKYYRRDSVVIHPPVDVNLFKPSKDEPRHGFVVAGRQTPYKRIDLAIEACSKLNIPLVVIGNGPEHKRLEKMAGRSVIFLTGSSDLEMARHFASAQAFIFPGLEDFGMVAVEAMAGGAPVIAYKGGGALDSVIPGKSGLFFDKQNVKSLVQAINEFNSRSFDSHKIIAHAQTFSLKNFRQKMTDLINDSLVAKEE
ncbi:MAG TPA: glycosyltransferase [Candidatus Dormibacteraeota bacterium]|nr:glycosyltransferase [Candidatus Dormibacteraeota bacterium]